MDVEADELSSSVSSLRYRQKMKQVGVDVSNIEGDDESPQNANQITEGEATVALTLVAHMVIVPLLVLLMIAYIKVRSEGDKGAIQVFDDPGFILSSILLVASSPALTLAQITQKAAAKSKSTALGCPAR